MEFISPEGLRVDGRRPKELRKLRCQLGVLASADGSAIFEMGNTKVRHTPVRGGGARSSLPPLPRIGMPARCLALVRAGAASTGPLVSGAAAHQERRLREHTPPPAICPCFPPRCSPPCLAPRRWPSGRSGSTTAR